MCGLLKVFGVEKEYYLPFFIDFDSQMDILKVYLEYLPKMLCILWTFQDQFICHKMTKFQNIIVIAMLMVEIVKGV